MAILPFLMWIQWASEPRGASVKPKPLQSAGQEAGSQRAVLAVLEFQDEEEAVRIANGTVYGLAAGVFTKDVARAHRVAKKLQAGTVWVNCWNGFDPGAPFGGYRQSGWGREMGPEALELYTQTKCVWVPL